VVTETAAEHDAAAEAAAMIPFLVHQNHRILFLDSNGLVVHLKLGFCFQFLRNDNGNES
jgi:hypothetical protein